MIRSKMLMPNLRTYPPIQHFCPPPLERLPGVLTVKTVILITLKSSILLNFLPKFLFFDRSISSVKLRKSTEISRYYANIFQNKYGFFFLREPDRMKINKFNRRVELNCLILSTIIPKGVEKVPC